MTEHDNPFSSRYIRPGAIPYYPCDGRTPAALADQFLQQASPMAAIVGPHGSGKSTLLHAMIPFLGPVVETHNMPASELERNGVAISEGSLLPKASPWKVAWFRLHAPSRQEAAPSPIATANRFFASLRFGLGRNQQVTNALLEKARDCVAKQILIVDGYEQLSGWQAWWLRRRIRASASRLLVTSHQRIASIPTLITTKIVPELEGYVLKHLLGRTPDMVPRLQERAEWKASRERWGPNLRASLFEMYDLVENLHA